MEGLFLAGDCTAGLYPEHPIEQVGPGDKHADLEGQQTPKALPAGRAPPSSPFSSPLAPSLPPPRTSVLDPEMQAPGMSGMFRNAGRPGRKKGRRAGTNLEWGCPHPPTRTKPGPWGAESG